VLALAYGYPAFATCLLALLKQQELCQCYKSGVHAATRIHRKSCAALESITEIRSVARALIVERKSSAIPNQLGGAVPAQFAFHGLILNSPTRQQCRFILTNTWTR